MELQPIWIEICLLLAAVLAVGFVVMIVIGIVTIKAIRDQSRMIREIAKFDTELGDIAV